MKRLIDILVSGSALLVIWPVMVIIAVLIKMESKGPILYGAPRAGKGYRIFNLLKFRTMYTGADKAVAAMQHLNLYGQESEGAANKHVCTDACVVLINERGERVCETALKEKQQSSSAFFKVKNDPRITRLGRILRNTSLDELPQLINVLRGDMSVVGNRPLPLYEAEKLTSDEAALRFMAPAGITGLWQVTKRGKKGDMSEEERISLDKDYARDHSLKRDFELIFKTFPALFQKEDV